MVMRRPQLTGEVRKIVFNLTKCEFSEGLKALKEQKDKIW